MRVVGAAEKEVNEALRRSEIRNSVKQDTKAYT